jgi:hypothetical protein
MFSMMSPLPAGLSIASEDGIGAGPMPPPWPWGPFDPLLPRVAKRAAGPAAARAIQFLAFVQRSGVVSVSSPPRVGRFFWEPCTLA